MMLCCMAAAQVMVDPQEYYITAGQTVEMTASGADFYLWSPSTWLNKTVGMIVSATPEDSITYTVKGHNPGVELAVNGGFENGNTGFQSDYQYNTNLYEEGTYFIDGTTSGHHPSFEGYAHSGWNFMIVNGATVPGTNVWTEQISVQPNTYYAFCTWVCNVGHDQVNVARLQFSINGQQIGDIFLAPAQTNNWQRFYEIWYSGTSTSATITILNQNTTGGGNDFGLDDISFCQLIVAGEDQCHIYIESLEAHDDEVQTCFNVPVSFFFLENDHLLANYPNPDVTIMQNPQHGTVEVNGNVMKYTPQEGYQGDDVLKYKLQCNGQTSEAYVYITVASELVEEITEEVCESFTWHGITFNHSIDTMWVVPGVAAGGCDSTYKLHLTVNFNQFTLETPVYACNQYVWHGTTYTASGTYDFDTVTEFGCLHKIFLPLTIYETEEWAFDTVVCGAFNWNDIIYDTSGDYDQTFESTDGCDSIVTVHLTVDAPPEVPIQGRTIIYPATDILSGIYHYHIDSTGIDPSNVHWDLTGVDWILTPHGASCDLYCSSKGEGVLHFWTDGELCDISNTLNILGSFVDVDENDAVQASLFQNPVNDCVSISCKEIVDVKIYNVVGNLLDSFKYDKVNECLVDMKNYNSGIYIFEIITLSGKSYNTVIKL